MKLLMHLCCSNCSLYPLETFLLSGVEIRGFWFNPNIHPFTEFSSRLASVERLAKLWHLDVAYDDSYDLDTFLSAAVGAGPARCEACYRMRLDHTAGTARRMGLDGFTTTLLASPYQKFDKILEAGEAAARRHGVSFHAEDFRKGWGPTRPLVRELDLYRQKYCGCIYSEAERYRTKQRDRHG